MKRWLAFILVVVLAFGLTACNTNKDETPKDETPDGSSGEEHEIEISLDTHFVGTKENEGGETIGVYVFLTWYPERVDYKISEYLSDFNNVVYYQEGTMDRPEDDVLILERQNMSDTAAPGAEEDAGVIEMSLDENDLIYKVTWDEVEDIFVLGIAAEEDVADMQKA